MPDRRNATSTRAGVLRPDLLAQHVRLVRHPCGEAVEHWVENYWTLRWDLPGGQCFTSAVLPHPACTLSVERGSTRPEVGDDTVVLTGVVTERFEVTLTGSGWVLGVKFRPGGLAALAGLSADTLTDRVVPAARRLPHGVVAELEALRPEMPPAVLREHADRALAGLTGGPDPQYATVLRLVGDMLADRSLLRVSQLMERHGLGRRRLERLFARYIGVSPKWVLARYRMHDAVTAIDEGYTGPLVDLAVQHGWYDQAHFNRDFQALVGTSPGRYRERV